jgi:hypothetical protein
MSLTPLRFALPEGGERRASLSLSLCLSSAARLKLRWRARTTKSIIIFRAAAIDYQAADDRLV